MIPLFYFDQKNKVVLHPDCIKLCPDLTLVSEKELLWIILSYDYYSPFHQLPQRDKERRAAWEVFDEEVQNDLKQKKTVQLAIEAYNSLQYSPKIEYIKRFNEKIDAMFVLMGQDDSPTSIERMAKTIQSLRKTVLDMQNEVADDVKRKGVIKGDASLSLLEQLQQNMKSYIATLKTKPYKSE